MNTALPSPKTWGAAFLAPKKSTMLTETSRTIGCPICASFPKVATPASITPRFGDFGRKCASCGLSCGKPSLLDLFSGAGGAARGYQEAGFCVLGVDHLPQLRYIGCRFIQADAMTFPLDGFDVIHASPPCQRYSAMSRNNGAHPDLYDATRQRLLASSKPWIIENVIGAPYQHGCVLCGSMFGLKVRRHRNFETSWLILLGLTCDHAAQGRPITVTGHGGGRPRPHSWKGVKSEWPIIMGMPWATPAECTQAIPPAYTEYIGRQLIGNLY